MVPSEEILGLLVTIAYQSLYIQSVKIYKTLVLPTFQFVLLAMVAVAATQYQPGSDRDAQTSKNEAAIDDSFVTDVETSNGIVIKSYGESLPGPEPETSTSRQKGSYDYVVPDSRTSGVVWVADENGFRAISVVIWESANGQSAPTAFQDAQ